MLMTLSRAGVVLVIRVDTGGWHGRRASPSLTVPAAASLGEAVEQTSQADQHTQATDGDHRDRLATGTPLVCRHHEGQPLVLALRVLLSELLSRLFVHLSPDRVQGALEPRSREVLRHLDHQPAVVHDDPEIAGIR